MDQELQKNRKIVPFNAEKFQQIDYTMENPENWLFEDELEQETEMGLENKSCEKVKIMDIDSNKF